MNTSAELREVPQSEETVFDGLLIHVNHMQVTLPNGHAAKREIVYHNGGAAIIPVDENENIYMVRQHRVAVDEMTLEIPAGKLEYRGADFRDAAIRELEEETGLRAQNVELLTSAFPTPGYCNEILGIFRYFVIKITTKQKIFKNALDKRFFLWYSASEIGKNPKNHIQKGVYNDES